MLRRADLKQIAWAALLEAAWAATRLLEEYMEEQRDELQDADLRNSELQGANFTGANLKGTILDPALHAFKPNT